MKRKKSGKIWPFSRSSAWLLSTTFTHARRRSTSRRTGIFCGRKLFWLVEFFFFLLADALERGVPFPLKEGELIEFVADPLFTLAIMNLPDQVYSSGVSRKRDLERAFFPLQNRILALSMFPSDMLFGMFVAPLLKFVPFFEDEVLNETLRIAEAAVAAGDLESAARVFSQLDSRLYDCASEWLSHVRAYLEAEQALLVLRALALSSSLYALS